MNKNEALVSTHHYGDNIDTDRIIAGKYTKTLNMKDLGRHVFEDLDANFINKVSPGDIIVAGENFGCGSSREQAPLALLACGIEMVLAKSFARIFFRNAINVGLRVATTDTSEIPVNSKVIVNHDCNDIILSETMTRIQLPQYPPFIARIVKAGGLVSYLQKNSANELYS